MLLIGNLSRIKLHAIVHRQKESTMSRIERNGLQVASELVAFVEEQALPGTGVSKDAFWAGLAFPSRR